MCADGKAQANFFLWLPITPKQRIAVAVKCDSLLQHALFFSKKSSATAIAPGKLACYSSSLLPTSACYPQNDVLKTNSKAGSNCFTKRETPVSGD